MMIHTGTNPSDASSRHFVFQTPGMLIARTLVLVWGVIAARRGLCRVQYLRAVVLLAVLAEDTSPASGRSPPLWLSSLPVRVVW
jgi:hypothetical protein